MSIILNILYRVYLTYSIFFLFPTYRANLDKISDIFVTLDSHNREHIAHSKSWNSKPDGTGDFPAPFTQISHADIVSGKWFPTVRANQVRVQSIKVSMFWEHITTYTHLSIYL